MRKADVRLPALNSLRFFEVAARHMSFTKAANELHVTQSAVSHRIKTLEEELGFRLFKREQSKLILTEEGAKMLPELTRVFNQLGLLLNSLKKNIKKKPLRIVLRPYFAQSWLLPKLPDFWARYPEIDIHLEHSIYLPDFNSEYFDLAILWANEPHEEYESMLLVDGGLTVFCNPTLKDEISRVQDLYKFLLLDEENSENWNEWLQIAGLTPENFDRRISIDDTNVRIQAAIDGTGLVLTCPTLLNQNQYLHRLIAPFPDLLLNKYNYYLVHHKRNVLNEQAEVFINWVASQI